MGDNIFFSIIENDFDKFKHLFENNANVNTETKVMLFMLACMKGNIDMIKYLVTEGNIDINTKDDTQTTALMLCCGQDSNLDIVKYLVEQGADVNVINKDGLTALTIACKEAHNIARYLISEGGANMNLKDSEGNELPFYKYLTSFIVRLYF